MSRKKTQRLAELEDKWKRALADYHNLEKRVQNQQSEFIKFANNNLITKLLSILDDLERAQAHTQDKGLKLITARFIEILKSEGVEEIKALNQQFDPQTMEAVDMIDGKKNTVIKIINKGYTLNNKVLRPVKVNVGKGGTK